MQGNPPNPNNMGFAMLLLALNQEAQKLMYPDCNSSPYSGGQLITCPEEPPSTGGVGSCFND